MNVLSPSGQLSPVPPPLSPALVGGLGVPGMDHRGASPISPIGKQDLSKRFCMLMKRIVIRMANKSFVLFLDKLFDEDINKSMNYHNQKKILVGNVFYQITIIFLLAL